MLERRGVGLTKLHAQRECCRQQGATSADCESSQAGIHAPGNQPAHIAENLQARAGASVEAGQNVESASTMGIGTEVDEPLTQLAWSAPQVPFPTSRARDFAQNMVMIFHQ